MESDKAVDTVLNCESRVLTHASQVDPDAVVHLGEASAVPGSLRIWFGRVASGVQAARKPPTRFEAKVFLQPPGFTALS
jgi:hypothetical protein